MEFTYNEASEKYESVLTISEIITASATNTCGFMRTDTKLDGALDLALNIPYVISAIYENEPGTYDIDMTATEYVGLNPSGLTQIYDEARPASGHITFTAQK